jgi:tRNA1Val (adenine37-N6)-methyltransferase
MSQLKAQLRRDGFTFKQFFVAHDRCAMKVGTDGILLGAWAPVAGVKRILDIGTGSGLVALMLAQRTEEHVTIDAVELDAQAAEQASENGRIAWAARMKVECADVLAWAPEQTARYDLIVSNPPTTSPALSAVHRSVNRRVIPVPSIIKRCSPVRQS